MEKIKKRYAGLVVSIILLILSIANLILVYLKLYELFPKFKELLALKLVINNNAYSFSWIFLLVSWILVIIMLFILLLVMKSQKQRKIDESYTQIKEKHGKFNTELDALYTMIEKSKKIKLIEISKAFKISDEKALEWSKILENNNLVLIEYPAFSSPQIILKEENEEE